MRGPPVLRPLRFVHASQKNLEPTKTPSPRRGPHRPRDLNRLFFRRISETLVVKFDVHGVAHLTSLLTDPSLSLEHLDRQICVKKGLRILWKVKLAQHDVEVEEQRAKIGVGGHQATEDGWAPSSASVIHYAFLSKP